MRKGFTLVELLIVLAVIAALMAVATPLALNAVKNAKASQVAQNFRNIKAAVENYFNTEKPEKPTEITLDSLKEKYLSSVSDDMKKFYEVKVEEGTGGEYNVTITYKGKDVDANKVRDNGMKDVQGNTGDNLTLKFSLQKWW